MLWNDSGKDGDVRSECEADECIDCEDRRQRNWLVKVDRLRNALCFKCMTLIVEYIFLADVLFLRAVLDLDKYIFPLEKCFFGWLS